MVSLTASTVESYVELFNTEITRIVNKHAPLKTKTRRVGRNDCRWLSAEARAAKRRCRRLERHYRRTAAAVDKSSFQSARRDSRAVIAQSRSDAIRKKFSDVSGDSAATWRVVRDVLYRDLRQVYNDDKCRTLSAGFCDFFTSKIDRIRLSIANGLQQLSGPLHVEKPHLGPLLSEWTPTTAYEVRRVLTSSRLKPSPVDVLPVCLLRSSVDVFAPIFAHMANLSFTDSRFPVAFKTAQVLPLLKKPTLDKQQLSNYRPISNLSTASKVIERLVLERLRPHLMTSLNFSQLQSAYRHGHSTETALLRVLDSVYAKADHKRATLLVGLDISAAFDTIDHHVLINRLQHTFGVTGAALNWLQSYLDNRHQYVKLGRSVSSTIPCDYGVPQGSVLGPLLFTAYMPRQSATSSSHTAFRTINSPTILSYLLP